jgi:hypothetical protein
VSFSQTSITLTQLNFGFRRGVMRTEEEEGGIISVSYGVEPTAVATFELTSDKLQAPLQFTLDVMLDERGVDGATALARQEALRFLASLSSAEFRET